MAKVREALAQELCRKLEKDFPQLSWGFFGGHFYRDEKGGFIEDTDEIPVIELPGLCDIELGRDGIDVTAKLRREQALEFDFSVFDIDFEAYGVEDWMSDHYHPGLSLEALRRNVEKSADTEIFFSFRLETDGLREFVKKIKDLGFYY